MIIYNKDIIIGKNINIADSFFTKLVGLMGKKELNEDDGLLLMKCNAIHCFFMKIPIDAIYLSKEMKVLGMETLSPWRFGRHIKNTVHVLELSAGSSTGKLKIGDQLVLSEEL